HEGLILSLFCPLEGGLQSNYSALCSEGSISGVTLGERWTVVVCRDGKTSSVLLGRELGGRR
ncbi:hypothetical protein CEXT_274021, partial [Caerostris extrusa]